MSSTYLFFATISPRFRPVRVDSGLAARFCPCLGKKATEVSGVARAPQKKVVLENGAIDHPDSN
jgi:hypothetical protein